MAAAATDRVGTWEIYGGWIAGGVAILAVLAVGAAFWFKFHP
jgi:hypothetical protein